MLSDDIEELRLLLLKIAADKELTDPRVVKISDELDKLINEYYTNMQA